MAFHTSQVLPMMLMGTAIAIAVPQLSMYAQETCPHAILRIETAQYVDQTAVCEAAEPWADNGYQVLVFLTDVRPASEDAWFNILDTVEAEAGLRDLTQADSFERAAIAIEATTATDLPYAVSLTYGEALYNTRLDTDEAALEGIKRSVRDKIAAQDATWGLTTGLEDTAALVGLAAGTGLGNPSSGLGEPSSALPAVGGSGADAGVSITAIQDGAGRLAAGGGLALAGGGTVGALAWRRRRQRQMKAHLATLQSRIANLLMGCEQLLAGGEPDNTVSYQLFVESDGDRYPPLKHQVQTQLAEARQALDQAFQAHAHLQENEDALKRPLVQHVEAWEMLYLAFVGKSDRIRNMSDEELQTLLNPALVLGQSQTQLSQGLTAQLANIQGKIKGTPLKVELKRASAEGVDEQGILGRVEQVDAIISRLQKAVTEAPKTFAAIQARRQKLDALLPSSLQLPASEAFAGIDEWIAVTKQALERDRLYLRVIEDCDAIAKAMDLIARLNATFKRYDQQQAIVQGITQAGYRPAKLHDYQSTINQALEQLRHQLREGQYQPVPDLLTKLADTSAEAEKTATAWRDHHQQNQETLRALTVEGDRLVTLTEQDVVAAWQALRQYPQGNWADLGPALETAHQILQKVRGETLPHLYQQNDLPVQALPEVSQAAEAVKSQLQQAEDRLQQVLDRHALIRSALVNLSTELAEIEAHIQSTTRFVTNKILGIFATNKPDTRLQEAQSEVDTARYCAQEQEYLLACEARDKALRLVLFVKFAKVHEKAAQVSSLVNDRDARGQGKHDFEKAQRLMLGDTAIRQAQGRDLFARYVDADIAWQHLETAERLARRQIRRSEAARKRRTSSSYASRSSSSSSSFSSSSSRSTSRSSSSRSSRSSSSRSSSSRSSGSRGSSRRR